jgi:esterase/lipase
VKGVEERKLLLTSCQELVLRFKNLEDGQSEEIQQLYSQYEDQLESEHRQFKNTQDERLQKVKLTRL